MFLKVLIFCIFRLFYEVLQYLDNILPDICSMFPLVVVAVVAVTATAAVAGKCIWQKGKLLIIVVNWWVCPLQMRCVDIKARQEVQSSPLLHCVSAVIFHYGRVPRQIQLCCAVWPRMYPFQTTLHNHHVALVPGGTFYSSAELWKLPSYLVKHPLVLCLSVGSACGDIDIHGACPDFSGARSADLFGGAPSRLCFRQGEGCWLWQRVGVSSHFL